MVVVALPASGLARPRLAKAYFAHRSRRPPTPAAPASPASARGLDLSPLHDGGAGGRAASVDPNPRIRLPRDAKAWLFPTSAPCRRSARNMSWAMVSPRVRQDIGGSPAPRRETLPVALHRPQPAGGGRPHACRDGANEGAIATLSLIDERPGPVARANALIRRGPTAANRISERREGHHGRCLVKPSRCARAGSSAPPTSAVAKEGANRSANRAARVGYGRRWAAADLGRDQRRSFPRGSR